MAGYGGKGDYHDPGCPCTLCASGAPDYIPPRVLEARRKRRAEQDRRDLAGDRARRPNGD